MRTQVNSKNLRYAHSVFVAYILFQDGYLVMCMRVRGVQKRVFLCDSSGLILVTYL